MDASTPTKKSNGMVLDYRVIIGLLLVVIAAMLLMWRPWEPQLDAKSRTISVTGQAKVTAVPDEYVFSPAYEFKNADRSAALSELTKKSNETVKKLKELGVADNKIKTNSDGYDYPIYDKGNTSTPTYTLRLAVTVDNKDLAQKVQDYLVTTAPTGAVSPQLAFSDAKRKELESKARDEATKEARSKAGQSAENLGFTLGAVKSVNDGTNFGGIYPVQGGVSSDGSTSSGKLDLQPGENDLTYQVSVVYYVK
jgi:uncharacterized protein YggE